MKINLEVDCTPEEARRAVGLPDLAPIHEKYVTMLSGMMDGGVKPEMLENLVRSWAPMGEASLVAWRRLFESTPRPGG